MGAAGALLLVSLFLPWYSAGGENASAWEVFSVVDVTLCLLALLAIALPFVVAAQDTSAVGIASETMLTILALIVSLIAIVRVLNLPEAVDAAGGGREPFAWVGLLATLGVLMGSLIAMRDERLSKPGRLTDTTGVPVDSATEIEQIPAPPREAAPS